MLHKLPTELVRMIIEEWIEENYEELGHVPELDTVRKHDRIFGENHFITSRKLESGWWTKHPYRKKVVLAYLSGYKNAYFHPISIKCLLPKVRYNVRSTPSFRYDAEEKKKFQEFIGKCNEEIALFISLYLHHNKEKSLYFHFKK